MAERRAIRVRVAGGGVFGDLGFEDALGTLAQCGLLDRDDARRG
jgi:hypothetical protein